MQVNERQGKIIAFLAGKEYNSVEKSTCIEMEKKIFKGMVVRLREARSNDDLQRKRSYP